MSSPGILPRQSRHHMSGGPPRKGKEDGVAQRGGPVVEETRYVAPPVKQKPQREENGPADDRHNRPDPGRCYSRRA